MDDYTPTAISEKFDKVANLLSLAEGYAFSNDNLSHMEECSRWGLLKVCCEVVRKATEQGVLDPRSLQDFLDRRRGL